MKTTSNGLIRYQCKDVADRPILERLEQLGGRRATRDRHWDHPVRPAVPDHIPDELLIKKMGRLINRGLVDGCDCGRRGDHVLTPKGQEWLRRARENPDGQAVDPIPGRPVAQEPVRPIRPGPGRPSVLFLLRLAILPTQ